MIVLCSCIPSQLYMCTGSAGEVVLGVLAGVRWLVASGRGLSKSHGTGLLAAVHDAQGGYNKRPVSATNRPARVCFLIHKHQKQNNGSELCNGWRSAPSIKTLRPVPPPPSDRQQNKQHSPAAKPSAPPPISRFDSVCRRVGVFRCGSCVFPGDSSAAHNFAGLPRPAARSRLTDISLKLPRAGC
jgi:hypothetical protein